MKLTVTPLRIPDVKLIRSERMRDHRGYFAETYVRRDLVAAGIGHEFIQDNEASSLARGTIRGLHFQIAPFAQAKLIRVLRGRILDVAVDLRRSSQTFGEHVSAELDETSGEQLLVPAGFAHGYCTLEPDTVVFYKVDNVYAASHERGIRWSDPALGIRWPVSAESAIVSEKDTVLPLLAALPPCFE